MPGGFVYSHWNYIPHASSIPVREKWKSLCYIRYIRPDGVLRDLLHDEGHQIQSSPGGSRVSINSGYNKGTVEQELANQVPRYAAVLSAFLSNPGPI